MEQSQENRNEVKPPQEPDKPKKELTEEQRQKQKKFIIYPLMVIIFLAAMWLIFAPSEKEKEQEQAGFNTDVPAPADSKLLDDKQAAYEQEMLDSKQAERQKQMQSLAFMFGSGDEQEEEMPMFDEPEVKPKSGYGSGGGSESPHETIHASANAYRDMNRTLGNFTSSPKKTPKRKRCARSWKNSGRWRTTGRRRRKRRMSSWRCLKSPTSWRQSICRKIRGNRSPDSRALPRPFPLFPLKQSNPKHTGTARRK